MSGFTSGPWNFHKKVDGLDGIGIHSANGGYVYVAEVFDCVKGIDAEANARLIAAAPDGYLFALEFLGVFGTTNPFMKARQEISPEELNRLIKLALEFIAKAEGK